MAAMLVLSLQAQTKVMQKDIKKAFKNNRFHIGLSEANGGQLLIDEIGAQFELLASEYDIPEKQLNLTVQLPSEETNGLLSFLASKGNINRFEEKIPSANEIFIRTVQSKSPNE